VPKFRRHGVLPEPLARNIKVTSCYGNWAVPVEMTRTQRNMKASATSNLTDRLCSLRLSFLPARLMNPCDYFVPLSAPSFTT
jgi:hypothetical protein